MARVPGRLTKVYVDEFDFSGRVSAVEIPFDITVPEITSLADLAGEFVEGQYKASIVQNGFFDGVSGNIDAEMWADLVSGSDHLVGVYPGNSALAGKIGYEIDGRPDDQARPLEVAGAILLNVTWQGNGPAVRAMVLKNGAVTGAGAIAGQNVGVTSSSETCVGILRVLSVSGTGSITVKIQESSDNGVGDPYADLFTFTAATGVTSERKTTTNATEAYKKVNVSAFSGFTSVTILVVVGKELS